jgi:hypothetical protein
MGSSVGFLIFTPSIYEKFFGNSGAATVRMSIDNIRNERPIGDSILETSGNLLTTPGDVNLGQRALGRRPKVGCFQRAKLFSSRRLLNIFAVFQSDAARHSRKNPAPRGGRKGHLPLL